MTKLRQRLLLVSVTALTLMMFGIPYLDMQPELYDLKTGKTKLYCHFEDGIKYVPQEKVTGKKGPYWIFNNGSASNCWTQQ